MYSEVLSHCGDAQVESVQPVSGKAARRLERKARKEEKQLRRNPKPIVARNSQQKQYIKSLIRNSLTLCAGPAGVGKALTLDTPVRVPGGWIKMRDVKVGTVVVGADGEPTTVMGVYPQGTIPVYRVTFKDGRTVDCCDEHLWRVYNPDWADGWKVIPTKDIRAYLDKDSNNDRMYIQQIEPERGVKQDLPIHPYVLGALLGDGGLTQHVKLSSADEHILDMVRTNLPEKCSLRWRSKYDYAIVGEGRNNPVLQFLRDFGLMGKKSDVKFVPDLYMESHVTQRLDLLRGLMDTDGTVGKAGAVSFTSTSEVLAKNVQTLVWSLGGQARLSKKQPYYSHNGERYLGKVAYTVSIRGMNLRNIFTLPRKLARLSDTYQYEQAKLRIDSIEYVADLPCQCISVDSADKLFVVSGYIVTHNTYVPSRIYGTMLLNGEIEKLYVARPNVAKPKHRMGYLPGTAEEKTAPWLIPIFDGLRDSMSKGDFERMRRERMIEEVPFEHIQGRTFRDAACIVDEAENLDMDDLYITLTRQGENLSMVLCGDIAQARIPDSGFAEVIDMAMMEEMEDVGIIVFTEEDIVRSGQAKQWAKAFSNRLALNNAANRVNEYETFRKETGFLGHK